MWESNYSSHVGMALHSFLSIRATRTSVSSCILQLTVTPFLQMYSAVLWHNMSISLKNRRWLASHIPEEARASFQPPRLLSVFSGFFKIHFWVRSGIMNAVLLSDTSLSFSVLLCMMRLTQKMPAALQFVGQILHLYSDSDVHTKVV